MLIRNKPLLRHSDVTPRADWLNRRKFLAAGAMSAAVLPFAALPFTARAGARLGGIVKSPLSTTEPATPYDAVTGYNNFYEFGTGKNEPVKLAKNFQTSPWTVSIEGEVAKPKTLDLDAIMKLAPLEERI